MTSRDQTTASCRQVLAAAALALTLTAGPVNADDIAYVFQYEITFGQANKTRPIGSFYLGFQPRSNDDWSDDPMKLEQGVPLTKWQQGRIPVFNVDEKTDEKKSNAGAVLLGLLMLGGIVWAAIETGTEDCLASLALTEGQAPC